MARNTIVFVLIIIILILSIFFSIAFGSVNFEFQSIIKAVFKNFFLDNSSNNLSPIDIIIWTYRIPRVLLACVVGIGLAMVGVVLQALIKNPLADPQLLGVSSGASVGAVISIIIGLDVVIGEISGTIMAFLGGLLAFIIVLSIANFNNNLTPLRLILAGTSVSFFCSSITSFLSLKASNLSQIKSIQFWLLGGLSGSTWGQLPLITFIVLFSGIVFFFSSKYLNVLSLGDDIASTLGINPKLFRVTHIILCALVIAVIVANCGNIGFIGLVIPHIVRLIVGADNQKVLPISMLIGGILMVICDLLSRIILSPEELPIGIITSIIGAPFFAWLIVKDKNSL